MLLLYAAWIYPAPRRRSTPSPNSSMNRWIIDPPCHGGVIAGPLMQNFQLLRSRVLAWYERLKALPNVDPDRCAAIGYCFGGQCVLELARMGADLKAVISYHGVLKTTQPAASGTVRPLVAIYSGAKDPYVPAEDID